MNAEPVRFHLSLHAGDLPTSIAFYRALFGVEPAKVRSDYAKFETDEPPLVLSLEPGARPPGGNLDHLGLRFPDMAALVAAQERLERNGVSTKRESGVECCYAKQTKFWVFDPDRTLWEIYILEGDLEHRGAGQSADALPAPPPPVASAAAPQNGSAPRVWEHRFGDPVAGALDYPTGCLDEVRLNGSFNRPVEAAERARFLAEIHRVLKPGGTVHLRNLVADRPLPPGPPNLPGPAAVVEAVPVDSEVFAAVENAGFEKLALVHFEAAPCFTKGEVAMRQLRLEARKPRANSDAATTIMYRGPFKELRDDAGRTYPRGGRVAVAPCVSEHLRAGPLAEHFVFFDGATATACDGS